MAEVLCESLRVQDGVRCSKPAVWVVRIGTRNMDSQWSCARHLHQWSCARHLHHTCTLMYESEERAGAELTVKPVHPYER